MASCAPSEARRARAMSLSHVTRINQSCHTCEWVMSYTCMSSLKQGNLVPCHRVMSCACTGHVTDVNELCHTLACGWVKWKPGMRPVRQGEVIGVLQCIAVCCSVLQCVSCEARRPRVISLSHVTRINKSCQWCDWYTWHLHVSESSQTLACGWVKHWGKASSRHVTESRHTYQPVVSHVWIYRKTRLYIWTSHVTCTNVWTSNVAHINERCHTCEHVNTWCCTYEWVMSHVSTREQIMTHVWVGTCHTYEHENKYCRTYARIMSHIWTHEQVMSHMYLNRVARVNLSTGTVARVSESCHTYEHMNTSWGMHEWVMSHIRTSDVAQIIKSCHT